MQIQNTGLRNISKKVHGILYAPKFLPPPFCLTWSISLSTQEFLWLISLIYSFQLFCLIITGFHLFSLLLLCAQYEWQCLCYWGKCGELYCMCQSLPRSPSACVRNPTLHLFFTSRVALGPWWDCVPSSWPGARPVKWSSGGPSEHRPTSPERACILTPVQAQPDRGDKWNPSPH